jgi:hypothetical protein
VIEWNPVCRQRILISLLSYNRSDGPGLPRRGDPVCKWRARHARSSSARPPQQDEPRNVAARGCPRRRELRGQGVDVIVIEPGGVKTPIWKKGTELADDMLADAPPEAERLYGRMIEAVRARTQKIERETGGGPRAVADVIGETLTASRPRARYLVGGDAKLRARMSTVLPARVMDRLIGRAVGG